jgi:hypothetical protein
MSACLTPQIGTEFSAAIDVTKFFGPDVAEDIRRRFEVREQPAVGVPGKSCETNLFFGFFFDGTKNNYIQAETIKNHSNVARLYDCYPGLSVPGILPASTDWQHKPERYTHFFKVYVPGVSSPFPQVGDTGTGLDEATGGASGAYGERRIIWALLQSINNVHRYFLKAPLVTQGEIDVLVRRIVLNKYARTMMTDPGSGYSIASGNSINLRARQEFKKVLLRLKAAIAQHRPDPKTGKPSKIDPAIVKRIFVSTFGFSRGATEARVFANWLQSLCKLDAEVHDRRGQMSLGGFEVVFDFLGIFDTVASVGLGNTMGNNTALMLLDGHAAWADTEDSLRISPGLKCLHLVAAHDLRRSFPVDSISVNGNVPEGSEEIVMPGVHSDVGCGYSPGAQGKGIDPNGDDMLSRIPLLMMYKAARMSGVPLKLETANSIAKNRFALKSTTIVDFNAYIATCQETKGSIHKIMREQGRKQMEWRLMRRITQKSPLHQIASFLRASAPDQSDLQGAAKEFEKEIAAFIQWRKEKGTTFKPAQQKMGFDNEHLAEWEEIARWWQESPRPPDAVVSFFDNYVHDSRAGFKIAGSLEPFTGGKAGYLRFRKIYGGEDSVLLSALPTDGPAANLGDDKDSFFG